MTLTVAVVRAADADGRAGRVRVLATFVIASARRRRGAPPFSVGQGAPRQSVMPTGIGARVSRASSAGQTPLREDFRWMHRPAPLLVSPRASSSWASLRTSRSPADHSRTSRRPCSAQRRPRRAAAERRRAGALEPHRSSRHITTYLFARDAAASRMRRRWLYLAHPTARRSRGHPLEFVGLGLLDVIAPMPTGLPPTETSATPWRDSPAPHGLLGVRLVSLVDAWAVPLRVLPRGHTIEVRRTRQGGLPSSSRWLTIGGARAPS